jgi:SPP1 gp7 family putative phage head morphogenesis protein
MTPDLRLPNIPGDDATHTKTLRTMYRRDLRRLFRNFRDNIRLEPLLEQYVKLTLMDDMSMDIDEQLDLRIHAPSHKVIKTRITQSYKAGKRQASENPRIKRARLTIPYELNFADQELIHDLEVRNFELIRGATGDMKAGMLRVMSEGLQQNKGIRSIAKDMRSQVDYIMGKRADLIVHTEIGFSYNNAMSRSYQDAGIKKWQWLAAMGERTCPICESKHGTVFKWGDAQPPEHPRCLCIVYPVVDKPFEKPGEKPPPLPL